MVITRNTDKHHRKQYQDLHTKRNMDKINKEVIKTIRKLVFDDNGHVDKSNPHMDIIFEEAYNLGYKDGLKQGKRPRIKGVK